MLPTSHSALMIGVLPDNRGEVQSLGQADDSRGEGNCSTQAAEENQPETQATNSAFLLADAFSEFIATSSRLEISYRELQHEVYGLGLELAERNAELNTSLAENERMRLALQQIVDSMPCGVMVVEREGEISMINPETGRLLGLDGKYGVGEHPATVSEIATYSGVNLEMVLSGHASWDTEQEFCIQGGGGGKQWLEIRNRRLFHQACRDGKPDQTILILRDITVQKRAEQDREAGRNAMAVAEVTTILAHEIRNPLASLELFAELIELDEERRGEWISNLRAGIRTLAATVNNVLSFHGSGSSKLVPLPLAALVGNAIQFVRPLADQAGILIEWWDGESEFLVDGNEAAIQQVMLNLLTNAIRHTPMGGTITVCLDLELDDEEGRWCAVLECSDTGSGIRRDQLDKVFKPGFSGSGDTSGLGLAVCERIMKQHGGRISASNLVRSGARFRLEFPSLQLEMVTA